MGLRKYFVEEYDGGAFNVLCDDMPSFQREIDAAPIVRCCENPDAGCPGVDLASLRKSRWIKSYSPPGLVPEDLFPSGEGSGGR